MNATRNGAAVLRALGQDGYWYDVQVSHQDLGWIRRHTWRVSRSGYVYRKTSVRQPGMQRPQSRTVYLHREILGLRHKDGMEGNHLNRDTLDNRRPNLAATSHLQNMRHWMAEVGVPV